MASTNMGADTVCPFYKNDQRTSIRCQGVCLSGSSVQYFGTRRDKERWQRDVCSSMKTHRKCPIASMLYELYED